MREEAAAAYDVWVSAIGGATDHSPTWEELAESTKAAWRAVVAFLGSQPRIGLGQHVRDRLTGLYGIATARIAYLYGCERIYIEPRELKDGRPIEGAYVDEPRIEAVDLVATTPIDDGDRETTVECARQQAALALRDIIENVSEEHYSASWHIGIERQLWMVVFRGASREFGVAKLRAMTVERMRTCALHSGLWWAWDEQNGEPTTISLEEAGRRFVA